jgi:hypothetical protein
LYRKNSKVDQWDCIKFKSFLLLVIIIISLLCINLLTFTREILSKVYFTTAQNYLGESELEKKRKTSKFEWYKNSLLWQFLLFSLTLLILHFYFDIIVDENTWIRNEREGSIFPWYIQKLNQWYHQEKPMSNITPKVKTLVKWKWKQLNNNAHAHLYYCRYSQ